MLGTIRDSVLPPGASEDQQKQAAIALLEWIATKSEDKDVLAAGDMLGLTNLSEAEVRAIWEEYKLDHGVGHDGPKRFALHGRRMRLLIAAHYRFQVTINGVDKNESNWVAALVDELCALLDSQERLTNVAVELGLVEKVADPDADIAVPAPPAVDPSSLQSHVKAGPGWLIPAAVGAAVILVAATVLAFNLANSSDSPTQPPAEPLLINTSWPLGRGCDGTATMAMLPGKADVNSFAVSKDSRRDIAAADGAGVWIMGHLYLNLVGVDGTHAGADQQHQASRTSHADPCVSLDTRR